MPGASMTTYATNNSIGSVDPKDLFDNSQNFDMALNSQNLEIWKDRFGKNRKTWFGIEKMAASAISSFGYITLDSFQSGATLNLYNQVLRDTSTGEYYRWDGTFPKIVPAGSTPGTTGGIGLGAWVSVGDAALRTLFTGKDGKGLNNFYGGGGWTGSDVAGVNIYNNGTIKYTNALRQRFSIPLTDSPDPVQWIEKKSNATRDDGVSRWEQGCFYGYLEKQGGSAYGAAATFAARHEGGTGQLVGAHFRGEARHANAEAWGGWSYGAVSGDAGTGGANTGAKSVIVHEFNLNNGCSIDKGWMVGAELEGNTRGLVCTTTDGSNRVTHMINIGRGSAAPNGFIWTGMLFRGNSIVAPTEVTTVVGNGEYMRLEGSILSNAANGIRFRSGNFRVGISLTESGFSNNCAILLGDNQRITVGTGPANTTYLSFNRTENWANFNNLRIRLNGNQVISERRTGWGSPSGTTSRAAFNSGTITHEDLAKVVAALIQDLHASTGHGLIGLT